MKLFAILAIMFALLLSSLPVAFSLGSLGLGMLVTGGFSPLMAPQAMVTKRSGKREGASSPGARKAGASRAGWATKRPPKRSARPTKSWWLLMKSRGCRRSQTGRRLAMGPPARWMS